MLLYVDIPVLFLGIRFVRASNIWMICLSAIWTLCTVVVCKQSYLKSTKVCSIWESLKSDSTHHFFRNACTKSGSLRFSVFRLLTDFVCLYTCEFWLSLWKIVRSSVICYYPYSTQFNICTYLVPVSILVPFTRPMSKFGNMGCNELVTKMILPNGETLIRWRLDDPQSRCWRLCCFYIQSWSRRPLCFVGYQTSVYYKLHFNTD
jgi:hypothetical protein